MWYKLGISVFHDAHQSTGRKCPSSLLPCRFCFFWGSSPLKALLCLVRSEPHFPLHEDVKEQLSAPQLCPADLRPPPPPRYLAFPIAPLPVPVLSALTFLLVSSISGILFFPPLIYIILLLFISSASLWVWVLKDVSSSV